MPGTVLFTASTWSHIANFHRPYLRAFRALGWSVHAACGGEVREIPEADLCVQLPFEKKMTAPANFQAQAQLRRLMEQYRYDLVCTHTSLAAFFTRRAAAGVRPRPKVVNMVHGYLFDDETPALKKNILLAAERLTAGQTDLLLTMNQWDYAAARKGRLGRRVENIPGIGVDFDRFPPVPPERRSALRRSHGIAPGDFLLLYAAEFSSRKNQAMLLRAMPRLPASVKLALPGQGALLDACRSLAHELGIGDRVLFPGHAAMPDWYAMADAAVSSSRSEGLPFNVMEAMYAGLPVAASAVKGHTDLIADGVTGLLFPFNDEAAFAEAIGRLLDHPEQAAAMGAAAHAAMAPYSLERVLPQVMELYLSASEKSSLPEH